ncbi:MAG: type IV pilus assembly protein PilM, partial [Phycisphaerae bacterium]
MAVSKPVWGIDLGQNALKAIRLRVAGDAVEAVDYAYVEHARILSSQSDTAARAGMVAETMKKFLDQHNLSKEPIVVAVPGQHTLARFVKLPPVDKKKIPEIVKYEAQQQIPFDMEEVIWDYQIFASSPEGTEVGIFAMRREALRDHLRFLSDLNLEPAAVQSAPLALYNALKFDGIVGAEPAVVLDIGAQNSDLIISDGESLWTRNIPIGGNHFTEALLKTFKLSFNKAENLKRTAATSKYARQIFQAMRPVFADLVAEIQRSIGFFTGQRRNVKLSKVVAMGNAFQLPGMVKFIQQNLGMEVARPTGFSRLTASEVPNAPELLKQLASFGVAYGLALQGLNKATITSSLLPPDIAKQIVWRKKTPWFYGAAACLVLSAGVIWGRTMLDSQAIASVREAGNIDKSYAPATENVNGVEVPKPDPQAFADLESEPGNPLAFAKIVDAVGKHLQEVLTRIDTLNDPEIAKAKDIAQLQTYTVVWPKILYHLHAALPPEDEVARAIAAGPTKYKELVGPNGEKYPRKKRKIIFIERMKSQYSNDVISLWN